jgi:hypothetical protein
MLNYPIIPGCKHRCQSRPADFWRLRTASQIVLLAFLSSVVGSVGLCQKILPSRLHSFAGLHYVHFTAACDLWKPRTPAAPFFDASQKSWGFTIRRCRLIITADYCTRPGCRCVPYRGVIMPGHFCRLFQKEKHNSLRLLES